MSPPLPSDFGLDEATIEAIRRRDAEQSRLFVRLVSRGCGAIWLALTVVIYARALQKTPWLGLLVAPLLALLGAGIAGLPVAIASGVLSWLAYPPHPKARALERYEAATAGIRPCDVCRLARGDDTAKEGVSYCGRCGAFLCPECRKRYDLRAIAALKRSAGSKSEAGIGVSEPPRRSGSTARTPPDPSSPPR